MAARAGAALLGRIGVERRDDVGRASRRSSSGRCCPWPPRHRPRRACPRPWPAPGRPGSSSRTASHPRREALIGLDPVEPGRRLACAQRRQRLGLARAPSRRGSRTAAASRHGSAAARHRTASGHWPPAPAPPPAATGRSSARGRWCRTAPSSISFSRCGNSKVSDALAASAPRGSRRRSRRCRARGPAHCWPPSGRRARRARPGPARSRRRRSATSVGTPLARAASAVLAVGSMPSTGTPGHEVLQQIAVVAGDLDHQRFGAEAEPLDHRLGVAAGMLHPARRVGGEIGVVSSKMASAGTTSSTCTRKQSWQTRACSG